MQTLALATILGKRKRQLNLPEEIVIEILSRLPLKSLVKFMLVSKQWRSLIQSSSVKSVQRNKVLICGRTYLHSIDKACLVKRVLEPVEKIQSHYDTEILGSCNGLLLIRLLRIRIIDDLFLWNPLTKCSKKVLSYHQLQDSDYGVFSGLCFDSSNNEYKAVMAFSHETPSCGLVIIGSFRNKTWTVVHFPYHVSSMKSGPVVNENLHWFASKESWGHFFTPYQIIYFNPWKNIFKKLPMPQPKDGHGDILLGLGVLEGCLCMVRSCQHPTNRMDRVEVLVMKKYGIKESWTTMFILSNLPNLHIYDNVAPFCFTKNAVYEESLASPIDHNWEAKELRGDARYVENSLSSSWRKMRKEEVSKEENGMARMTVKCIILKIFDGHNGSIASIYSKENLLNNVLAGIPSDLNRDEWVAALPRASVAGFVKTDKDFQEQACLVCSANSRIAAADLIWWLCASCFVTLKHCGSNNIVFLQPDLPIWCLITLGGSVLLR
ncbi:hypothetical protein CsSME_00019974 [Camellia sinensis var. sinensis]